MAQDIDAVRAALGVEQIDLNGFSWGSVQARAYAVRYGERLRSLVLDSAGQDLDFVRFTATHRSYMQQVGLVCRRSATCRALGEDPRQRVARLVAALRRSPVVGAGYASY